MSNQGIDQVTGLTQPGVGMPELGAIAYLDQDGNVLRVALPELPMDASPTLPDEEYTGGIKSILLNERGGIRGNLASLGVIGATAIGLGAIGVINGENGSDRPAPAYAEPSDEFAGDTTLPTINLNSANAEPVVAVTDGELREAYDTYNCAPAPSERPEEDTTEVDYSFQIDYLEGEPEIAMNMKDFNIDHPQFGMGREAWEIMLDKALINGDTPEDRVLTADEEMNDYMHRMFRKPIEAPRGYKNFTCTDGEGNPSPITYVGNVLMGSGDRPNKVDGMVLDDASFERWQEAAENLETFDVIDLGSYDLTGKGEDHYYMIVLHLNGCQNPGRRHRITTTQETSSTTSTTIGTSTTSTTGSTTSTTRPTTSTTRPTTSTSTTTTSTPPPTGPPPTQPPVEGNPKPAEPTPDPRPTSSTTQPAPSGTVRETPAEQQPTTSTTSREQATTSTTGPNSTTTAPETTTTTSASEGTTTSQVPTTTMAPPPG